MRQNPYPISAKLVSLCKARRALSDSFNQYTVDRSNPKLQELHALDVQIESLCRAERKTLTAAFNAALS